MARAFSGGVQHLQGSPPVTAVPFTVSAWVYATSTVDANRTIVSISDSGAGNHRFWMYVTATNSVRCQVYNGSATGTATASASLTINGWQHVCAVFASATSRAIYLNGGNKGTNATNSTPTAGNLTNCNVSILPGFGFYWTGYIGEVGIWNVAFADQDVADLFTKVSPPLVHPEALVHYPPLFGAFSPEPDLVGGLNLTVTGATAADHPPLAYGGPVTYFLPSVAGGILYEEEWSGGITLAGSVSPQIGILMSGGVALLGTATILTDYTTTADGGVAVEGSATAVADYAEAMDGGTILGDTWTTVAAYAPGIGGTITIEGSNSPAIGLDMIGGVVMASATTTAIDYAPPIGGEPIVVGDPGGFTLVIAWSDRWRGAIFPGGTATVAADYTLAADGGIVLAGSILPAVAIVVSMDGGVAIEGSADVTQAIPWTGGLAVEGSAGILADYTTSMDGGVSLDGTAGILTDYTLAMAGGVVLAGTATAGADYTLAGSGEITLAGAWTDAIGYTASWSGGVVLAGSGLLSVGVSMSGGLALAGSAGILADYTLAADGGLALGGAFDAAAVYLLTGSGGVVLSGTTGSATTWFDVMSGGVVIGDTMSPQIGYTFTIGDEMTLSGTATVIWTVGAPEEVGELFVIVPRATSFIIDPWRED